MSENTIVERLTLVEADWPDVILRSQRLQKQHLRRQAVLIAAGVLAAAALAGGAYAAARAIWSGHTMSPAEIERQRTVVTSECDGNGNCAPVKRHREITILPSMGVTFVLPDGDYSVLVPGAEIGIGSIPAHGIPPLGKGHPVLDDSGNAWGTAHFLKNSAGLFVGGVWRVQLRGGGQRTIRWSYRSGAISVRDRQGDQATPTRLSAGDVVPLIPGSVTNDPRTLDKAVTFDLPTEGFGRVIIFPKLNETYINFVHGPRVSEPLPYGAAAKYGLTPIGDHNGKLPVTPNGGTWTVQLPDGLTRMISWHAGDSFVTVEDTNSKGTTTTTVPVGHELPLAPFRR